MPQELFNNHTTIADAVIGAYKSGSFTMRQIADHLGVRYSTVSGLLAKIEMLDCTT